MNCLHKLVRVFRQTKIRGDRLAEGTGSVEVEERAKKLGRLWWLTDAPMFIDDDLTQRFHDAIIWPELQKTYIEKTKFEKVTTELNINVGVEGEAEFKLPKLIDWLGPKLAAKAKLEGGGSRTSTNEEAQVVKGERIQSSERKLNDIVVEYLAEFPERLLFVDVPGGAFSNYEGELSLDALETLLNSPPRPLVFVNVKKEAPLFPTMAEMENGEFRPIFPTLDKKMLGKLNPTPQYDDVDATKRSTYWAALEQNFESRIAMQELEKACSPGRIGWIDFRILFDTAGSTGHLHIVPAGKAHAGVFGYNFVHRGYKYGCRVVATLKSGTDMNVLAIYER